MCCCKSDRLCCAEYRTRLSIYELDMGIKGAALATGIAETRGALVIVYYLVFKANIICYRKIRATLANMILASKN